MELAAEEDDHRLSFDVVSPRGGLLFTRTIRHPLGGRREVWQGSREEQYFVGVNGSWDFVDGTWEFVDGTWEFFDFKIPNVPVGSAVRFFDVVAGLKVNTVQGRAERRLIHEIPILPGAGGGRGLPVQIMPQDDGLAYKVLQLAGTTQKRYDIVFMGDGFTDEEQDVFNTKVDGAINGLANRHPYDGLMCAFNFYRINVVSPESGVDHPADGIFKNTPLNTRYGDPRDDEAERCTVSDTKNIVYQVAELAPDYDAVFVLVNDTARGGCASGIVVSSISVGFSSIATHELGHKIGGLADEYQCFICDGTDDDVAQEKDEPTRPNLTIELGRNRIKWGDLILPDTPLPTVFADGAGLVGAWEGGGYKAKGIHRPERQCQMESGVAFCAVCERTMDETLRRHCGICVAFPETSFCNTVAAFVPICPFIDGPVTVVFNWPLQICHLCPVVDQGTRIDVSFLEERVRGAIVKVADHQGNIIADSVPGELGPHLSATLLPSGQYFLQLEVQQVDLSEAVIAPVVMQEGPLVPYATNTPMTYDLRLHTGG